MLLIKWVWLKISFATLFLRLYKILINSCNVIFVIRQREPSFSSRRTNNLRLKLIYNNDLTLLLSVTCCAESKKNRKNLSLSFYDVVTKEKSLQILKCHNEKYRIHLFLRIIFTIRSLSLLFKHRICMHYYYYYVKTFTIIASFASCLP